MNSKIFQLDNNPDNNALKNVNIVIPQKKI